MNAQELIGYFENLRSQQKKNNMKDRMKTCLLFFTLLEVLFLSVYIYAAPETISEILYQDEAHKVIIGMITGIIAFFSLFMFFVTARSITFNQYNLSKNEDINLYDALSFIYEKERKSMSALEFKNFIEIKYERNMFAELIEIDTNDKKQFDKQKNDIQHIYANKEKLVTRGNVLKRRFYQEFHNRSF